MKVVREENGILGHSEKKKLYNQEIDLDNQAVELNKRAITAKRGQRRNSLIYHSVTAMLLFLF